MSWSFALRVNYGVMVINYFERQEEVSSRFG